MCMSRELIESIRIGRQGVVVVQRQLLLKERAYIDTSTLSHEPLQAIRCTARMTRRARAMQRLSSRWNDGARETKPGCPTSHHMQSQKVCR